MKLSRILFLLFIIFGSNLILAEAKNSVAEIKKLTQGLSRLAVKNGCDGKFAVKEQRRNDTAIWYELSYVLKSKTMYRQTFKSDTMLIMVDLTPIKLDGCNSLLVSYSQGASGAYQESYLVFPSASKFSYLALSQSTGYFSVEDLDSDGEAEIIAQKSEPSSDDSCNKFAYWGRLFHLDRTSGMLVEMNGENYPKYYASLTETLRNSYENIKNDRNVSARCKQTYLQLIRRAERLAQGRR